MQNIITKTVSRVKPFLGRALLWLGVALVLGGCLPPLPPEADRPPDPAVVMPPERHRGRAQVFALENYNQLLLLEKAARKRSHQWVFDREGIRFEEQKGEVALVLTGRYLSKFDAGKVNRQEEAEELWRRVVGPFLDEILVKQRVLWEEIFSETRFKLGFERVRVEVRFERENSAGNSVTQEGLGRFNIMIAGLEKGPKPQKVLNLLPRTEVQIDGKSVILREKVLTEES